MVPKSEAAKRDPCLRERARRTQFHFDIVQGGEAVCSMSNSTEGWIQLYKGFLVEKEGHLYCVWKGEKELSERRPNCPGWCV